MLWHFAIFIHERYGMKKTLYGSLLVVGPLIAYVASHYGRNAANSSNLDPSLDWYYDLLSYGSMAGIVAGIALFFFGAMMFARSK